MKRKNKQGDVDKLLAGACIVLALIAIGLIIFLFSRLGSGKKDNDSSVLGESAVQTGDSFDPAWDGLPTEGEEEKEEDSVPGSGNAENTEGNGPDERQTSPGNSAGTGNQLPESSSEPDAEHTAPDNPTDTGNRSSGGNEEDPAQEETVTLPYTIPDSGLVVRQISSYSGSFLEDGSDQEVSDVTVMILKNEGNKPVEYVSITMSRSDGMELEFEASGIPAGATVVVQEKNKAAYQQASYTSCTASAAQVENLELSEDFVKVEETGDGSLQVTNLTDQEIPCVRIFYKFYMEDEDAYVGGITYVAKLTGLAAGGSQIVTPSHYQAGYSRVVMVRTYDTAE